MTVTRRQNGEAVYNFKVNREHIGSIGDDDVLIHNACPDGVKGTGPLHYLVCLIANSRRESEKRCVGDR